MADHAALSALPAAHWIHKALAKTKKGAHGSPLVKKEVQMAEGMQS